MSTDRDWEKWGANNPYFGVLSDPKFMGSKLQSTTEKDFYSSGKTDIKQVMSHVRTLGIRGFKHAVDFGCGTGRLTIPLADYATKVMGLDVSPSVLQEAKKKTPKKLSTQITYELSDDQLSSLPKKYDLVHSFIVLQHIPPSRGMVIIRKLLTGLESGGVAALHITFAHNAPRLQKSVIWARNHFVPLHYALNIVKRRPWRTPRMRMHLYNLNEVVRLFNATGITETIQVTTDHGGYIGVMVIGKKQ